MVSWEAWIGFGGVLGMIAEKILALMQKKKKEDEKFCSSCGREKDNNKIS